MAQAISRDQKPSQNDEATRIITSGGRIDSFRDPDKNPIGPLRVWLKSEDIPGLAMTRSFGDEVASRVGVTAEPGKFSQFSLILVNYPFSHHNHLRVYYIYRDTGAGPE